MRPKALSQIRGIADIALTRVAFALHQIDIVHSDSLSVGPPSLLRSCGGQPTLPRSVGNLQGREPAEAAKQRRLAGAEGIEPSNAGIKIRCLTAWRHPNWLHADGWHRRKAPDHRASPSAFQRADFARGFRRRSRVLRLRKPLYIRAPPVNFGE